MNMIEYFDTRKPPLVAACLSAFVCLPLAHTYLGRGKNSSTRHLAFVGFESAMYGGSLYNSSYI